MKKFKLFKLLALLVVLITSVSQVWAVDYYLDISHFTSWTPEQDGCYSLWDGKSNIHSTYVAPNIYKFTTSETPETLYFKRKDNGSNQFGVTRSETYNVYKVTGWDNSGECANYNISTITATNYIYFDHSSGTWSNSNRYLVIGHDEPSAYSSIYSMTELSGTKLWCYTMSESWPDATYYGVINPSSSWNASNHSWGSSNLSNGNNYTGAYTGKYDLNNGSTYLMTASSSTGGDMTLVSKGGGYSDLNKNQTLYVMLSEDGGANYLDVSSSTWKGTIKATRTYISGNCAATTKSGDNAEALSSSAREKEAAITSTYTLNESSTATGYTFAGYGATSSATPDNSTTYTLSNISSTNNIYAFFKANSYTVRYKGNDNTSGSTTNSTHYYGVAKNLTTNGFSKTNYDFAGWNTATDGSGTAYTNGQSVTSLASTQGANYDIYAMWTQSDDVNANGGSSNTTYTATWNKTSIAIASAPTRTGYTLNGYYTESGCSNKVAAANGALQTSITVSGNVWTDASNKWAHTAASADLYAGWTANNYTVTLDKGTDGTADGTASVTFDNTSFTSISHATKTGYTLTGYWTASSGGYKVINADGTFVATNSNISAYIGTGDKWVKASNCTLYAQWTPNTYTVVFNKNNGSATGTMSNQVITYDVATNLTSNAFVYTGYHFDYWTTNSDGSGTQYADGAEVTNLATSGDFNLYAHWTAVTITDITLSPTSVAPSGTTTATAVFSPGDPTGNWHIDWAVKYSNDNPYVTTITNSANSNTASITAPSSAGSYKIIASLKTGTTMNAGTEIDSYTKSPYTVSGSHTVAVLYKDQSGNTIKESGSVSVPAASTAEVEAPSVFGYSFHHWVAGDGVTIATGTAGTEGEGGGSTSITISAIYDGSLTAVYAQKNIIYFKDNLGWTDANDEDAHIYVNLLDNDYWGSDGNANKGTGNNGKSNRNLEMSRVPGTTNIFYYDYGNKSTTRYVSFTKESMDGYEFFYQNDPDVAHVVYPTRSSDALTTNKATGLGFYSQTPMFVPIAINEDAGKLQNSNRARYYNDGYWTKFTPGTGYTLKIYYSNGSTLRKSVSFTSADDLMPMKAVANLEAGQTYKFKLVRDGDVDYGNTGTITYSTFSGGGTAWEYNQGDGMTTLTANAAGDYTFNLSFSADSDGKNRLRISIDFPTNEGDFRIVYSDNATWSRGVAHTLGTWLMTSNTITHRANGEDIVSFYISKGAGITPEIRWEKASIDGSTLSWGTTGSWLTTGYTDVDEAGVYNFKVTQNADGTGISSIERIGKYSGNYYIRTDAANSKWDNYRSDADHLMTYSEYSINHGGYSHYYTHWVDADDATRKNVKFCIANDYSPCISDTLTREVTSGMWQYISDYIDTKGDLSRDANVRYMWNSSTNVLTRAYIDGANEEGGNFLRVLSDDDSGSGTRDGKLLNTSDVVQDYVTFSDDGNWIYEVTVHAKPGAKYKLVSNYGTTENSKHIITQYFKGAAGTGSDKVATLIGGTGSDAYTIRIIYDFKTNRLVSSWTPSGNISSATEINADVMFVREHQGNINQVTFSNGGSGMGSISAIETAYGVLQFNKYTLNNKNKAVGHSPLAEPASAYERGLYWISFPFRVKLSEAFGFGSYGTHWIVMKYNGTKRATDGYWADSEGFWEYIWDRRNEYLEPSQGYVLALDLDLLGESSDLFTNTDVLELYFPSYGTMPTITNTTVTYELEEHECTIDRRTDKSQADINKDRTIADSHWNVMSVPTYVNTSASNVTFEASEWKTNHPEFFYEWNMDDNSYTARSTTGFTFKAMYAYMVQFYGDVTWSTSASPASPIAARQTDVPDKEYMLSLIKDSVEEDHTFVRMSDKEGVTAGFEFGQDLCKEYNGNKGNIYTFIGYLPVAGNSQPHPLTTTIVPVGVKIAVNGEYTFSMPEGTNGGDVWLIDNANSSRTNLGLMDYTVNLTTGTYEGRFSLEFPVQNVVTDIENAANANANANADDAVRKVFVGGQLYIIRDGVIYNASGARVQ